MKFRIPVSNEEWQETNTNKIMTKYNGTWKDFVDSIIDNWTTQNKSFTAYEVSKQVQADMEQDGLDFVRHRDMRDYIHEQMDGVIGYDKVYTDFGSYKAFQYQSSQSRNNFVNAITNYKNTVAVEPKYVRTPDARQSITIPKELVEKMGWVVGQTIYIINDYDGLHLTDKLQTQSKTSYVVDKNLNIRITKKHLPNKTTATVFKKYGEIIVT